MTQRWHLLCDIPDVVLCDIEHFRDFISKETGNSLKVNIIHFLSYFPPTKHCLFKHEFLRYGLSLYLVCMFVCMSVFRLACRNFLRSQSQIMDILNINKNYKALRLKKKDWGGCIRVIHRGGGLLTQNKTSAEQISAKLFRSV